MAISFFHAPKNRKFKFSPRYYDEQKEELENRVQQIKAEMGVEDKNGDKPYITSIRRGQMRRSFKKNIKQKRKSNMRLLFILIVLVIIVYFLLYF